MALQTDGDRNGAAQEVVRGTPRCLAGAAMFAVGVGVGALTFGFERSDAPEVTLDEAVGIGCGIVTLVLDAQDLPGSTYELRASVGSRMLPMINSMTYPLVGTHENHQSLVPDEGRLLVVANVPAGAGDAPRWELVGTDSAPVAGGVLPDTCPS